MNSQALRSLTFPLLAASLCIGLEGLAQGKGKGDVAEIFVDKGDTFIRGGTKDGLTVGMTITIVGATIADTAERRNVGTASVLEVWETISRVSLDRPALEAPGEKFAKLPSKAGRQPRAQRGQAASTAAAAPATAAPPLAAALPPPPPPPPTPPTAGGLIGEAHIKFPKRLLLVNKSNVGWSGCGLTLNDGRTYQGFHVGPWRDDTVRLGAFTGPETDVLPTVVDIRCIEGSSRFSVTND